MANQLDDFLAANTKERKPFSMTDYEAIPLENRQEYVKTTSIPARNQTSEVLNVEGQSKAKTPIASQEVQNIKAMFRTAPEAPPQQDMSQQPAAQAMPQQQAPAQLPPDDIDMGRIREQAASMQAPTSWEDWIPALAPLITEALMGGGGKSAGESLGISGKYLTDTVGDKKKRQQSLEDKLLDRDKARYLASLKNQGSNGSKRYQSKNVFDKESGKTYMINYDTFTGNHTYPDGSLVPAEKLRTGFAVVPEEYSRRLKESTDAAKEKIDYTPRIDPNTGLPSRVTPQGPEAIFPDAGALNPKQEKDLDNQIAKFLTTDVYKKNANALQSASTIDGLIQDAMSGNASSANVARSEIAKIAEGGGRLTDQDVERVGGPQDWRSKIARYTNLQKNKRPLLDSDIAELKQIANTISKVARIKLQDAMAGMETSIAQKGGVKGSVSKGMEGYIPKEAKKTFPMQVRKGGKIATISNEKELKEASEDGWQ